MNAVNLESLCGKVLFCLCVFWSSGAFATDYFVSPNGSASWPGCTTQDNPCLASRSSQAFLGAVAGDTVWFLDGTYSGLSVVNETAYTEPVWKASNSGTVDRPITFRALNRGAVSLIGLSGSRIEVPIIGSGTSTNEQYIVWDGFKLSAVNGAGDPVMAKVNIYSSDHTTVQYCEIIGATHNTGGAINYEGVRIEGSDYAVVQNNDIHGWKESSQNHNTSAIKSYGSYYATITNNYFYDNYVNVYIKANGNGNFDVKYNFFDGGLNAVLITPSSSSHYSHDINNNLIITTYEAVTDGGSTGYYMDDIVVRNNTFFTSSSGVSFITTGKAAVGRGISVFNNIYYSSNGASLVTRASEGEVKQVDHNLYYSGLYNRISKYSNERSYSSLSSWQSSGELGAIYDAGCGSSTNPGCGSIVSNPLFTNGSGSYSQIADFALASTSPGKGAGRGGVDMGADIALVGTLPEGGGGTPPPVRPQAPAEFNQLPVGQ